MKRHHMEYRREDQLRGIKWVASYLKISLEEVEVLAREPNFPRPSTGTPGYLNWDIEEIREWARLVDFQRAARKMFCKELSP